MQKRRSCAQNPPALWPLNWNETAKRKLCEKFPADAENPRVKQWREFVGIFLVKKVSLPEMNRVAPLWKSMPDKSLSRFFFTL